MTEKTIQLGEYYNALLFATFLCLAILFSVGMVYLEIYHLVGQIMLWIIFVFLLYEQYKGREWEDKTEWVNQAIPQIKFKKK